MNEYYARDTSKKIKSVFKAKGMSGKHLTGTVLYGYIWDESRTHWLVDEEAAEVVRRIFALTMAVTVLIRFHRFCSSRKVEIPSVHLPSWRGCKPEGKASRIFTAGVLPRSSIS